MIFGSNTSYITPYTRVMRNVPQRAAAKVKHYPICVCGNISPYPTVKMVMDIDHIAMK